MIDCDVHHTWGSAAELLEHMAEPWRSRLAEAGGGVRPVSAYPHTGGLNKRLDSFGPDGQPPGSDLVTLREQLLDSFGIERAILSFDLGHEAAHPNPALGAAIARAANDWSIARWLESGDPRLYGAVMVANQDPVGAAAEIRRAGGHPRMVEVLLVATGTGMPLGHPIHHPIYAAAEELGLPIAIHVGAETFPGVIAAGGLPATRFEYHTLAGMPVVHHLASFITHGVFERFPGLRVLLVEIGLSWLPWLLAGLDARRDQLAAESDWVRERPSDYVRRHVRVTTQPIEPSPRSADLARFLGTVDGVEDLLCFASDYPHWDTDDLRFTERHLPEEWGPRMFHDNAAELFGWTPALVRA